MLSAVPLHPTPYSRHPHQNAGGRATGGTKPARPAAFTTIEILAVLVLMAIVSAVAVLSLGASLRHADLDSTIDAIAVQDHTAREFARKEAAPLRVRFDPAGRLIELLSRNGASAIRTWEVPADYRIDRVLFRTEVLPGEETALAISSRGWMQPYALHVSGRGQSGWIVFGGFTGRAHRAKDEHEVQEQLGPDAATASSAGNDAR